MDILVMLIAQTTDPIRLVAVALGLWIVWNTFNPGRRLLPTAAVLAAVSLLMIFLIAQTQTLRMDTELFIIRAVAGFVACAIQAAIIMVGVRLFSQRRKRA